MKKYVTPELNKEIADINDIMTVTVYGSDVDIPMDEEE